MESKWESLKLVDDNRDHERENDNVSLNKYISKSSRPGIHNKVKDLYYSLDSLLSESDMKTIQFIGSKKGEGTSTLVREFALIAVSRFNKSVLLIDADMDNQTQHDFFKVKSSSSLQNVFEASSNVSGAIEQIERSNLFLTTLADDSFSNPEIIDQLKSHIIGNELQHFDYILVDAPPVAHSALGLAVAPLVDGVILTIEAEKTRWPMAESIRDRIVQSGGKILGIVFNKRRYYIPNFIYKRL